MRYTARFCRQRFGTLEMPGVFAFLGLACQQLDSPLTTEVEAVAE